MIPTLLALGLLGGHWWRACPTIAALGWPGLLLAAGTVEPGWSLAGAAGLAALNVLPGVLVVQAAAWVLHRRRAR